MTVAIKERGETALVSPADETTKTPAGYHWTAGEDVILKFRNSDLKLIEDIEGENFFHKYVEQALTGNFKFSTLETFLKYGVKKDGKPYVIPDDVLDQIPVFDLAEAIMDGLCRAMRGMSAKAYVEETFKAFQEAADDGAANPPKTPETGSTPSVGKPSEPASE